jgi:hypothetical protein
MSIVCIKSSLSGRLGGTPIALLGFPPFGGTEGGFRGLNNLFYINKYITERNIFHKKICKAG